MSDFEEKLRDTPSLEPSSQHRDATVHQALHAFHVHQRRKHVIVPFVAAFLGAAASVAIVAVFYLSGREPAQLASEELSRDMIVQAYRELRETFPEGLSALVFIDGEMQIFPGLMEPHSLEPTYIEMMIGSTEIKVIAAQGATLPVVVNGSTVLIELMPDASGQPTVSGEDFYWSTRAKFMPSNREVLRAEQMEIFL